MLIHQGTYMLKRCYSVAYFVFNSYLIDRETDRRHEFVIDSETGVVKTRKKLDREVEPRLTIYIKAVDKGKRLRA